MVATERIWIAGAKGAHGVTRRHGPPCGNPMPIPPARTTGVPRVNPVTSPARSVTLIAQEDHSRESSVLEPWSLEEIARTESR